MPINTFCSTVRDTLLNVIDDHVLRKNEFVKNPHSDFTRNRIEPRGRYLEPRGRY